LIDFEGEKSRMKMIFYSRQDALNSITDQNNIFDETVKLGIVYSKVRDVYCCTVNFNALTYESVYGRKS
jgi:hypothetical protein